MIVRRLSGLRKGPGVQRVPIMHFQETDLRGAFIIEPEPTRDERGFFARTFCTREFAEHGLETRFVQHSISYSAKAKTLRGLHFQARPHAEVKVVSCLRGAIWDVIVDLRPDSATFRRSTGVELTHENRRQLYIPRDFAHGFITLKDDTEVHYLISDFYEPSAARGVRHDDPAFAIDWPFSPTVVSEKDGRWPDFAVSVLA